jgi:predicted DNA-binding transcriptional regulator AlpA
MDDNRVPSTITHLGLPQVARALGVSTWTVQRWTSRNQFPKPVYLIDRGPPRWSLRTLESFIAKRSLKRRKLQLYGAAKKNAEASEGHK